MKFGNLGFGAMGLNQRSDRK